MSAQPLARHVMRMPDRSVGSGGDRMETCFLCRVSGLMCLWPVPSWSYLGCHRDLGWGFWEHSGLRWQSCLCDSGHEQAHPKASGPAPVAGAPLNTFCPIQMDVLPNTLSNFLKKTSVPLFTLEQVLTSGEWYRIWGAGAGGRGHFTQSRWEAAVGCAVGVCRGPCATVPSWKTPPPTHMSLTCYIS